MGANGHSFPTFGTAKLLKFSDVSKHFYTKMAEKFILLSPVYKNTRTLLSVFQSLSQNRLEDVGVGAEAEVGQMDAIYRTLFVLTRHAIR